ncbi:MAG: LemA family protein [Nitrospirota bacterium]|nr:LemA family protein [Nitrospirota bacterium]
MIVKAILIIIPVVVFGIFVAIIGYFNKFVKLKNLVRAAWSDIDVMLKKRHDLIPNLVETVRGAGAYEKSTLERVIQARSSAMAAVSPADKGASEGMLTGALKSLFALSESYPALKANENYLLLQNQIKELEDSIEGQRKSYNAAVMNKNILIESFPSNIVASLFGFKRQEQFTLESPSTERQSTQVKI